MRSLLKQASIRKWKKYLAAKLVNAKLVPGQRDYQKFIVLGRHRVGSNMLLSVLNQHLQLHSFSEPFSESTIIFGSRFYGKPIEKSKEMLDFRNSDPIAFLEEHIWRAVPEDINLLGFKIFYPQLAYLPFQALTPYFKGHQDIKVIHLKRKNLLDLFISTKIARQNKVMIISNDRERSNYEKNNKLKVEPEEIVAFFKQVEGEYTHYKALFEKHDCLPISYEDLIGKGASEYQKIFSFLGLGKMEAAYAPQTRKQNQQSYAMVFENWPKIHNYFINSKWAGFLTR